MKLSDVFQSNYLKASDLNDKDVTLTITGAKMEELVQGQKKDTKLVLSINGTDKRFVLNKTNATTISKLHGDDTDNWIGKKIMIGAREVEFQGTMTMALRVLPKLPVTKPSIASAEVADELGDINF